MLSIRTGLVTALLLASYIYPTFAQGITCNATSPCPDSDPCCSEFGFCGSGPDFCLGGCNAILSNKPTSCAPAPLCKSGTYTFNDPSRLINASLYDGNATAYDWVINQGNVLYPTSQEQGLTMLLTESNGGTRLASTRYMWYGSYTARMRTGRWDGVVVASVLMSDIKDEIDWEAPGNSTSSIQSNVYILGIADYNDGATAGGLNDTFADFHDYTVNWQPHTLEWFIDGKLVRSINNTASGHGLPASPSRIEISIWPAGINSSAQGTIQWSGGLIDWNNADYKKAGYFDAVIDSITVNCSALPSNAPPNVQSYIYGPNVTRSSGISAPEVLLSNLSTIMNGASNLVAINAWTFWTGLVLGGAAFVF